MTEAAPSGAMPAGGGLRQLLMLLQHGDSQFPSGAFGFSWGLEGMLADGAVDGGDLEAAIAVLLSDRWAPFDRPVLRRAWRAGAGPDLDRLAALDADVEAALLVPVERAGSVRAGAALLTSHLRLGNDRAPAIRAAIRDGRMRGHRPVVEGALWRGLGLAEGEAALLSGYGFAAALCAAAVRLGRLGALGQQAILAALLPRLAELAGMPDDPDAAPESFNPLAEIAMLRQPLRASNLFAT